jgi:arylsulfatase A-like enzyme
MMGLVRGSATVILLFLFFVAADGQVPLAPSSAANGRPNVLIIVTDDQRAGLSVMPATRRWLRDGGTEFKNAIATTPLCCPSRASIFTGRYAHNHHVFSNGGDGGNLIQESTLQFYLRQAGYETALFGKYLNRWGASEAPPYFDRFAIAMGSRHYYDGVFNVNGNVPTVRDYNTSYIRDKAVRFLQSNRAQTGPWFLYLATAAPHDPFTAQPKYAQARVSPWAGDAAVFEKDRSDKPPYVQGQHAGIRFGRKTRAKQFRTLMSVDDMVSRVFHTLKDLGEARNTLVLFISDNGFMWGEHGLRGKSLPYEQAIRVPFLARWPGHFRAGAVDNRLVANIDIAPTILEAAGITPDPAYPLDGRSLLGSDSQRQSQLTEYFPSLFVPTAEPRYWASIRSTTFKYTEYYSDDGTTVIDREYYNLRTDPWELHNLLGDADPANDPDVAVLSAQLAHDRACEGTVGVAACP